MRVFKRALVLPAVVLALSAAEVRAADSSRMEAARATFAILDMDEDEKVTFREFALRKVDAFSAADRNSDGNLEEGEVFLTREQFAGADEDRDGRVRLLEFIDSRYGQFDIYDGDSNGTVDLEEFTRNLVGD